MKKLYIRFFTDRNLTICVNSYVAYNPERDKEPVAKLIGDTANNVYVWMTAHPNGKVDYIWA